MWKDASFNLISLPFFVQFLMSVGHFGICCLQDNRNLNLSEDINHSSMIERGAVYYIHQPSGWIVFHCPRASMDNAKPTIQPWRWWKMELNTLIYAAVYGILTISYVPFYVCRSVSKCSWRRRKRNPRWERRFGPALQSSSSQLRTHFMSVCVRRRLKAPHQEWSWTNREGTLLVV